MGRKSRAKRERRHRESTNFRDHTLIASVKTRTLPCPIPVTLGQGGPVIGSAVVKKTPGGGATADLALYRSRGLLVSAAACILPDGRVFSLPAPARHHDVMRLMHEQHGVRFHGSGGESGFLLNDGRFVTRKAAEHVARAAGQIRGGRMIGSILTTEDLW